MKNFLLTLIFANMVIAQALAEPMADKIETEGLWARATTTYSHASAVYGKIINRTGVDDALVAVTTPVARMVEIHRTVEENGAMQMVPMEKVVLKDSSYVEMEPGDLHIMLMGLNGQLVDGREFPMTFQFESGKQQNVKVSIKPMSYRGEKK